jgi:hypothetical protein
MNAGDPALSTMMYIPAAGMDYIPVTYQRPITIGVFQEIPLKIDFV